MQAESLLTRAATYLNQDELALLQHTYRFAEKAHQGQFRRSGEPYILHPTAVAGIVSELQLDVHALMAALLHDVVEDTKVTLADLEKEFGVTVADLVDGVTKLRQVQYSSREERQAENYRKMFLAMAKDIRVVLVKLADRLHNLRTLRHMPEHKQRVIAQETLEIFAPLARRLGISKFRWELEDIAFRYLNPKQYYRIANLMKEKRGERESYLEELIDVLRKQLNQSQVHIVDISGRPKHIYSIYRKMIAQQKPFHEIYDLIAIRILVENVRDCYAALGIVHTVWIPMPGRFKDYIAMPKSNMYQSLHTTVMGPRAGPIEAQIRTEAMHKTAEYGVAAHWAYKEGVGATAGKDQIANRLQFLREMLLLQNDTMDAEEFVECLKMDWFTASVFAFTPCGDVIELPVGSGPLDFAFRVHTEVGYRCVGAKVNGKMAALDHKLQTGDVVEVLTSKNSCGPSYDWLRIVKSSHASSKIRSFLRRQRREESIVKGREMLEVFLRSHNLPINAALKERKLTAVAHYFRMSHVEELFIAVACSHLSASQVVTQLTADDEHPYVPPKVSSKNGAGALQRHPSPSGHGKRRPSTTSHGVMVDGIEGLLVRMSRCCCPVPGDTIAGHVTRGRGVAVHRAECANLTRLGTDRQVEVEWAKGAEDFLYEVEIEIIGTNRNGFLNHVLQVIRSAETTLTAVSTRRTYGGEAVIDLRLRVRNKSHLQSALSRVRQIGSVDSVKRRML